MKSDRRVKFGKALLFAVLFATLAFVSIGCASADTIYVPDDYAKIQWAIDNATTGDTIFEDFEKTSKIAEFGKKVFTEWSKMRGKSKTSFVYSGTYFENIVMKEGIELIGSGANSTIIDGGANGHVIIAANSSTISGFAVTNGGLLAPSCGIYCNESIIWNNQLSKDLSVITPPVFTDVASEYGVDDSRRGYSAVWFDYDNDGDLDILITPDATAGGDIYTALYRNDGDTFVDVADEVGLPGLWSHLSVGDYDNDGDIDILYARLFQNDINKTGNFTGVGNYGQTFVDYDNDGDLDTYSALFWGSNKLFRNDGAAGFVEIPGALGLDDPSHSRTSVWGDYDDDGDMDVYLVNGRGEKCLLYRNDVDTTGLFTDVTDEMGVGDAERYANGASWADYDNDGDLDLYLNKCEAGTNRLYRNDGEVFTEVAAELGVADKNDYGGFHSSWGDYDNDGDLDLYVTSRDGCPNRLYRNEVLEGNGFVETGEMQDISGRGMGGSWGDFDGDGDLDYYLVSGYYGTVPNRLYLNNCSENGNHWLHIKAIGTISNRAAIGTTIRVVTGDLVQTRYVESTSGFGSQNSLPVEFGLGAHLTVDSVIIRWPSGIVQRLTDVATNQVITVTESTIQREHDIAVTSIDAPNYAEPNSTIFINSTISNVGLNNEFNITTNFLVDEVNQSNTTISFIESENSTNVSFQWSAPSVAGIYNITIYAEPVVNETMVGNNQLSKSISVITFPVHNINTGESFPTVQSAIDDSD